ncbi:hypothetical protein HDU83_005995 [Entophlyctis luteolus]|nr:hypothetical protein HDU83_005995 [Entophlyctis luteolus]
MQSSFGKLNRRILFLFVSAAVALSLHIGLLWHLTQKAVVFADDGITNQMPQSSATVKHGMPKIPSNSIPALKPVEPPLSVLQLTASNAEIHLRKLTVSKYDKISGFGDAKDSFKIGAITNNFEAIRDRLTSYDTGRYLSLPFSDFELNQTVSEIFFKGINTAFAQDLWRTDAKYFHECGNDRKRDVRFADMSTCPVYDSVKKDKHGRPIGRTTQHDRKVTFQSLVGTLKAWSKFAEVNDIAWWIAHGELLGWFWNGKLLPWDTDLDIQVSMRGLLQLAYHNQTKIEGRYLVDVGNSIFMRTNQAQNVIDARIVDTKTGYFIDITGLAKLASPNADAQYNAVHCKTPHKHGFDDIIPLAETELEGVRVWRPRKAMKLLKEEYGEKALYSTEYREWGKAGRWKFNSEQNQWMM